MYAKLKHFKIPASRLNFWCGDWYGRDQRGVLLTHTVRMFIMSVLMFT